MAGDYHRCPVVCYRPVQITLSLPPLEVATRYSEVKTLLSTLDERGFAWAENALPDQMWSWYRSSTDAEAVRERTEAFNDILRRLVQPEVRPTTLLLALSESRDLSTIGRWPTFQR